MQADYNFQEKFPYLSTYNDAYVWHKVPYPGIETWPRNRDEKLRTYPARKCFKDSETLQAHSIRHGQLPLRVYVDRKPIIETSPSDKHVMLEMPPVPPKCPPAEIPAPQAKSLPVIPPTVHLPDEFSPLHEFIYSTTTERSFKEAALPCSEKPTPGKTDVSKQSVRFKMPPDPIPEGWHEASLKWDEVQDRNIVDPTCAFWERYRQAPKKKPLELSEEQIQKIIELSDAKKLRLPYVPPIPGYGGHVPQVGVDIPLKRPVYTPLDTRLSTSEAVAAKAAAATS